MNVQAQDRVNEKVSHISIYIRKFHHVSCQVDENSILRFEIIALINFDYLLKSS